MDSLEQKVRCLLEDISHSIFNKRIDVFKKDDAYTTNIYLHQQRFTPLTIIIQAKDDDDYLQKIYKELKARQLHRSSFIKIKLEDGKK